MGQTSLPANRQPTAKSKATLNAKTYRKTTTRKTTPNTSNTRTRGPRKGPLSLWRRVDSP